MCESLLDGSYWSTVSPRKSRSIHAKKQPLVFPVDHIPQRRKSNKPRKPMTPEQKLLVKEKQKIKRNIEKSKIESEHKKNQQKQNRKFEGILLFDKILLGGKFVAKNDDLLRESNVVAILNVTPSVRNYFKEDNEFLYKRISVMDSESENIEYHFPEATEFINQHTSLGKRVLVHCEKGLSRSPTIVIAWMMKYQKTNLKETYNNFSQFVGEEFFNINDGFKKQLMNWDMLLFNCNSTDFFCSRNRTPTKKLEVNSTPPKATKSGSPKKSLESPSKVTGFKRQRIEIQDKHEKYSPIVKLGDIGNLPGDTGNRPADNGSHPGDTGSRPDTGSIPGDTGNRPGDTGSLPGDTGSHLWDTEMLAFEIEIPVFSDTEKKHGDTEVEKRASAAENRARDAEKRASNAENRAGETEKRASNAENRAVEAEKRARDAEKRARDAEKRARDAEKRARDAEKRAGDAEKRAGDAEKRAGDAEKRAGDAEKRACDDIPMME